MLFLCIYIRNGFGFIIYDLSVILHKSEIINLKDMKIRAIIVLALIVCGIVSTIFYVKANQVSTNEKAIIEAIQTKNTPALIQALISRMKNQLEKDVNTFPELIKEV